LSVSAVELEDDQSFPLTIGHRLLPWSPLMEAARLSHRMGTLVAVLPVHG